MRARTLGLPAAALLLAAMAGPARAQLMESYIARLSPQDHYNSSGERLTTVAAIIRQDRANFHRFGRRDPEDQGDVFFASAENRARMERMLNSGRLSASARDVVIKGTPLIRVEIHRENGQDVVIVTVF